MGSKVGRHVQQGNRGRKTIKQARTTAGKTHPVKRGRRKNTQNTGKHVEQTYQNKGTVSTSSKAAQAAVLLTILGGFMPEGAEGRVKFVQGQTAKKMQDGRPGSGSDIFDREQALKALLDRLQEGNNTDFVTKKDVGDLARIMGGNLRTDETQNSILHKLKHKYDQAYDFTREFALAYLLIVGIGGAVYNSFKNIGNGKEQHLSNTAKKAMLDKAEQQYEEFKANRDNGRDPSTQEQAMFENMFKGVADQGHDCDVIYAHYRKHIIGETDEALGITGTLRLLTQCIIQDPYAKEKLKGTIKEEWTQLAKSTKKTKEHVQKALTFIKNLYEKERTGAAERLIQMEEISS